VITLEEATSRLVAMAPPSRVESVPLTAALGRVPAPRTITAPVDVPPFANSAMDGFAVRAGDLPGTLRLVGEAAAGVADLPSVVPGAAIRISTGAQIPPGGDAVVPIEDATETEGAVQVSESVQPGAYVRAAGHDIRAGDSVALPVPLTPAAIGVLGSLGLAEIEVQARPRVAILSNGDELTDGGVPLSAGHIYDANTPALATAVSEIGGEPFVQPRVADEPQAVEAALRSAAEAADIVLTSGGVSVGRHDHIRDAISRLGELDFWRIAVQPGKPLAVGRIHGRIVIGLPGNPVSALVVTELLVRPLLRTMLGLAGDGRHHITAILDGEVSKDPERVAYLRVRVRRTDAGWAAGLAGGQLSSQLRALADANGLLAVPRGVPAGRAGEAYDTILTGEPD
jgi:molybdopterin molybdotransferase